MHTIKLNAAEAAASRIESLQKGGGNIDDRRIGAGCSHRLQRTVLKDGQAQMHLATLTGRHAANHLRAVFDGLLRVKGTLGSR